MNIPFPQLASALEKVLLAIAVLVAGYILARWVRKLLQQALDRTLFTQVLGPSFAQISSGLVYVLILVIALFVGLTLSGIPDNVIEIIFLILLGVTIAILAFVGLALQQSATNLAATVVFLIFQPLKRGELIETMGRVGTVREILPFHVVLEMVDHRLVTLANSKVQDSGIVNYSRLGRIVADVSVSVNYDEDLEQVRRVLMALAAEDKRILVDPPPKVLIEEFGERGVRVSLWPTVAPAHLWDVRSDLRAKIKTRFAAENIQFAIIPAPPKPIPSQHAATNTT